MMDSIFERVDIFKPSEFVPLGDERSTPYYASSDWHFEVCAELELVRIFK